MNIHPWYVTEYSMGSLPVCIYVSYIYTELRHRSNCYSVTHYTDQRIFYISIDLSFWIINRLVIPMTMKNSKWFLFCSYFEYILMSDMCDFHFCWDLLLIIILCSWEAKREMYREIFHRLVHSPDAHNSQDWTKFKVSSPELNLGFSYWCQGPKYSGHH